MLRRLLLTAFQESIKNRLIEFSGLFFIETSQSGTGNRFSAKMIELGLLSL